MEKSFVTLEQVTKIYGKGEVQIKAVDGIDLSIEKGEFAIIVGQSGAGKTTVLNILGGMDQATSGHVWVDGQDVAAYPAGSSRECRSPGRWQRTRSCSYVTNQRGRLITRRGSLS